MARLAGLAADDLAAAQALRLLELAVLGDPRHKGALDPEMRASRSLLARLQLAVVGTPAAGALAEATEAPAPAPAPAPQPEPAPDAPAPPAPPLELGVLSPPQDRGTLLPE